MGFMTFLVIWLVLGGIAFYLAWYGVKDDENDREAFYNHLVGRAVSFVLLGPVFLLIAVVYLIPKELVNRKRNKENDQNG